MIITRQTVRLLSNGGGFEWKGRIVGTNSLEPPSAKESMLITPRPTGHGGVLVPCFDTSMADKVLAVVALKNGLTRLVAGSCTFDPSSGNFTFKVEGVASGGVDRAAALYNSMRKDDDELPPLGHAFVYQTRRYEVTGANTTGTKIKLRRDDGKPFTQPTDLFKAFLAKAKGVRS